MPSIFIEMFIGGFVRAANGRDLDKKDKVRRNTTLKRHQQNILKANQKWLNTPYKEQKITVKHPWKDKNIFKDVEKSPEETSETY